MPDVAARRLGEDEAYLTVRDILSEASTVADGALSRERNGFYRCGFATLGLRLLLFKIHLTTGFELIWKEELSQLQTLIDFQWKIVPFFIWDYAYKNSWQVQQIK